MTEGIATPIASSPGSTARGSGGRSIGYGEFGDPNGKPVILFHGFGDSRLTRYPDDELTARLGIRLITFDRPGIGLTDPMKELTILDRTDDVIDLTNSLGLHDVHLLGWSGGAPYALAAAGCMAAKVKRAAIVSGFGPFERPGFKRLAPREIKRVMTILKVAPWMANVMAAESQKSLQGDAAGAMEASRGLGGPADAGVLNMSGVRANVTSGAEEAFRQGPAGVANDMLLLFRFKWGFNPEDVHAPIDLWYGDDDQMTPSDVGRGLASILPQPRLRTVPGAGHLLYLRNWEEILRTLVADGAPSVTTTFQAIAPLSPGTETLAAGSLSEKPPLPETEHAEQDEPVAAQDDVLGRPPAWSWTQPAASEALAEVPEEKPAEREPVAYQAEPVVPRDKPAFVPRPRATPAGGDQLARLRALGFIVETPEPEPAAAEAGQLEAAEAETEQRQAAEAEAGQPEVAEAEAGQLEPAEAEAEQPEAEAAPAEHEGVTAGPDLALVEAEAAAEPQAGVPTPEPGAEAEIAGPEPKLGEFQAAPKRPSLNWQPMRVPGLIIGKPRRVVPVEPIAQVAEPAAGPVPEAAEPEPVAELTAAEPEATVAEPEVAPAEAEAADTEPQTALAEPDTPAVEAERVAEPETEAFTGETEAAVAQNEAAPVAAEPEKSAEPEAGAEGLAEPAADAEPPRPDTGRPTLDSAETQRLRAAGFVVSDPETAVEEAPAVAAAHAPSAAGSEASSAALDQEPIAGTPETGPAEADAEIAPAEVTPESQIQAVAGEVEAAPVTEEAVAEGETEPTGSEPVLAETEMEMLIAEAEPAVADDEAEPAVADEGERVAAEDEGEPGTAESATAQEGSQQTETGAPAEAPASAATALEEDAPETVLLTSRESDAADRLAEAGFIEPQPDPSRAIAASAADAPAMKSALQTDSGAQDTGEQFVETGVGWVETGPVDAETAADRAVSHESQQDSPPEPMAKAADNEPAAPARDETLERLRAAGFLIGEPRTG